ncbi:MAG: histidine kinase dimerization/phospho-acceptor domain-containing protein [Pirellulales bacterium]
MMSHNDDYLSPEDVRRRLVDQYTEMARLAGGLAHEIRNPLSTIRLNIELLAEEFADSDLPRDRRALAKFQLIQSECQRLEDLLNRFLDFAKPQKLRLEPTDLNALLAEVLDFFQPRADEAKIEVVRYPTPDLPIVLVDPEAIRATVLNLLINALQAMPGGGQLVAHTRRTPRGVALDLIDTGCGMSEETLDRAFPGLTRRRRTVRDLGWPPLRRSSSRTAAASTCRVNRAGEPSSPSNCHDAVTARPRQCCARRRSDQSGRKRGRSGRLATWPPRGPTKLQTTQLRSIKLAARQPCMVARVSSRPAPCAVVIHLTRRRPRGVFS